MGSTIGSGPGRQIESVVQLWLYHPLPDACVSARPPEARTIPATVSRAGSGRRYFVATGELGHLSGRCSFPGGRAAKMVRPSFVRPAKASSFLEVLVAWVPCAPSAAI